MFAEAENELNGPTTAAYNAINMVRRRGFDKPINTPDASVDIPAGLSKADFFKYIVRERALELGGEGIRKYDLIRWNLLGTALAESKANMLKMAAATPMVDPSYMAGYPSYSLTNTLPASMYLITNTTADNQQVGGIWFNSLYKTASTSTPSGTTKIVWVGTTVNTVCAARYATGYVAGKGELLPLPQPAIDANFNLRQNPGY